MSDREIAWSCFVDIWGRDPEKLTRIAWEHGYSRGHIDGKELGRSCERSLHAPFDEAPTVELPVPTVQEIV